MESTSIDREKDVWIRRGTVQSPGLMEHVTPPEGTDVRAVRGPHDGAPVVLGELRVG